jgi:hypothetical protein
MKEKAIELFDSQGVEAVIKLLETGEEGLAPDGQVQTFDHVLRHAYWQKKDLPGTIRIGQAGIALGEQLASRFPDQASEIKSQVKAIQYNLASFTWPGWDEPGFEITPEQGQLGLAAAKENLRLAIELKKDLLPLSRAHWMLGAQQMAVADYSSAREDFAQAEGFASQAGSAGEALLAQGFALLTSLLASPGNRDHSNQLEELKASLKKEEHGEFFVKQIEDARRVFGS